MSLLSILEFCYLPCNTIFNMRLSDRIHVIKIAVITVVAPFSKSYGYEFRYEKSDNFL